MYIENVKFGQHAVGGAERAPPEEKVLAFCQI